MVTDLSVYVMCAGLPHPSAPVQGGDESNKIPSPPSLMPQLEPGGNSTTHLKKGPIAPGQEGVREFYLVVDAPPLNVLHEG